MFSSIATQRKNTHTHKQNLTMLNVNKGKNNIYQVNMNQNKVRKPKVADSISEIDDRSNYKRSPTY